MFPSLLASVLDYGRILKKFRWGKPNKVGIKVAQFNVLLELQQEIR